MGQQVGRRFFVALGSGRYCHLPEEEQLRHVPADIRAMAELFTGFGYQPVLPGLGEYDSAEQVRQKLRHWSDDADLTPDDVVVTYFAGHGVVADRDRHYLMCWDSHDEDPATTALATEDLVRILCRGRLRNLLLILDTCSGGAGGAEAASLALHTIAYRYGSGDSTGLWFLASARRKDVAEDGVFVSALADAVRTTTSRTGQRQRYLDLTELVKAVNERWEAERRGQRAELASGLVTGLAPFLPNSGYREELPPIGTDLEVQRRVAEQDLAEHFGPRSRGVEFESEQGLYFSGRVRVLSELVSWLTADNGDGKGRVVTGSPGCGKSAVLGRIVALSASQYRTRIDLTDVDPATVVPEGCVTAAVHARHKRLEDVVDRIACALGVAAEGTASLLQELTRRGRQSPPLVIVVDAVDEAGSDTAADAGGHGEPRRITRELLRPMSEIRGVRLLVGTRHELVTPLGPTFVCLDLDQPGYRANTSDVTGYVTRVLLAPDEPEVPTPYRGRPELATTVAQSVAAKAAGVYLYARTTARTLRSDRAVVDVSRPGWHEELPSEVGEAFDDYLARFGPDEPRVRRMLLALAFSEGKGLPRGRVWTTLSTVISGVPCTEEDVSWALDVAEAYIAEVIDDDHRSVYRLYHKALAEHLRATTDRPPEEVQHLVVQALLSLVPATADGRRDWFAAAPYVRQHLATHASAGGRLSELITDPGFLLACEPLALLTAFASVDGDAARRIRSSYEQIAHRLTPDRPLGGRAADLQLSARRCEANELADRVDDLGICLPWSARWAWWSASGVHRLLSGHTKPIRCVAVGKLDGRPIAVTGSMDTTARIWDLTTQRQIGEPLRVGVSVRAVAIGELGHYTVALTGGVDGTVRVWDLSAGQEYGSPLTGHTNSIESIVIGSLADQPVALTTSSDGTARIWDLTSRRQLGCDLAAHRRTVRSAALGELDGLPLAATGGDDKAVHVWNFGPLSTGADPLLHGAPLIGAAEAVTAVSVGSMDARTVALVGDKAGMLSLWDLAQGRQIGEPVRAHVYFTRSGVASVEIGEFDGRPVALTSGRLEARLWDLRSLRQIGQPLRGHVDDINAAAFADGVSLAVTVSDDRTARIWDLATDQPAEGHAGAVTSVAYCDAQGHPLAVTGGEDGTARVWDLRTRKQAGPPLEGHSGQVLAVAVAQFGGRMVAVTGGSDTMVRTWGVLHGTPVSRSLEGHTNAVRCVALGTLEGAPVVISGSEDGTVRVWDMFTGELVVPPLTGHIGGIRHLAVRATGQALEIVIATSLAHTYAWRLSGRGLLPPTHPYAHFNVEDLALTASSLAVAFEADRPVVLVTREGNGVYVYDIVTRSAVGQPMLGHTSRVVVGSLGRLGGRTVVASVSFDSTVRLWDLETGRAMGPPLEGDTAVGLLEYHPAPVLGEVDGVPVVVVRYSYEVRVCDLDSMRPVGEPLCGAEQRLISASIIRTTDGSTAVVTGGLNGTVRTHDLDDGRQIAAHIISANQAAYEVSATEMNGAVLLLRTTVLGAEVWDLGSRKRLGRRSGVTFAGCLCSLDNRPVAVSVARDYTLHAWDVHTQAPVCRPMAGHTSDVLAVRAATVNGTPVVASAAFDGTVRLWDLSTGQPFRPPLGHHDRGAYCVDFAHLDRELVVSGAGDGRVRVWDVADGTDVSPDLKPFASAIRAVRVARLQGTPTVIAADQYGQLRVWDMKSPTWTAELDIGSGINDIASDDTGRICVATDMGAVALRLNLTPPPAKGFA